MKIALFHNNEGGGVKRAIYEHARHLRARGYAIDLYVPSLAQEEFLPLSPLCENVYVYAEGENRLGVSGVPSSAGTRAGGRAKRLFRQVFGDAAHHAISDGRGARQRERAAAALDAVYQNMGRDMGERGYDLIYAHQCRVFLAPAPLFHAIRAAGNVPILFYCHDTLRETEEWTPLTAPGYDDAKSTSLRQRRLGRFITPAVRREQERRQEIYSDGLRAVDMVLANSYYSREGLLRSAGVNARVCYLGVDADFFRPDPTTPREREVLSVGALRPEKRHGLILEAVGRIPAARRPRLRIIGYSWGGDATLQRELTARAIEIGVALSIEGEVSDEKIREAYRRCAVVAFAPYLEPFGLVTLEAMSCGTPVVGVAEGGLRETIRHQTTGLLMDGGADELADALDSVVCDPAFAARLGAQGREDVCEKWRSEQAADRLEALMKSAQKKAVKRRST